ncbi:uncharacterized protein C1orf189 homolog [Alligator sinensis]|uniref:Uncharacterized protein C1orf189 homolog n=1 Tax=Alligator sinensis TaxID=38654 RepID=A0A3Q0HDB0_ALLSI|nr:uncharacterized protein C1orf189 homolog [Alligator sinensis]
MEPAPTLAVAPGKRARSRPIPVLQQILKQEEVGKGRNKRGGKPKSLGAHTAWLLAKVEDYKKLVQRWEQERQQALQRVQQEQRSLVASWRQLRHGLAEELRLASKELVLVRRAALCSLLQQEQLQHQQELARLGWAFYTERL